MLRWMKAIVKRTVKALGYSLVPSSLVPLNVAELEEELADHPAYAEIIRTVEPFTMTPRERIVALVDAVRYVVKRQIPGAIVECGAWRGGSMMAAALTLQSMHELRDIYLFDTFAGMTAPTEDDVDIRGDDAKGRYVAAQLPDHNDWCYASIDDVRRNLASTGYPADKFHLVQGDVLDTLPCPDPDLIALLRLDTDFYESTKHELEHLYERVSPGGVLIIDDYGHWKGCRKAVDEYFSDWGPLLCRIDYTARIAVKLNRKIHR